MQQDEFLKLIDAMSQVLTNKNIDIDELKMENEMLRAELSRYKQKELYEVVGTSSFEGQIFNVYEKFVPDFVSDDDIDLANKNAPKFESGE